MDITALLLACSLHPDDALLSALVYVHGRGNPYAIVDVSLHAIEQDDAGFESASSPKVALSAVERIVAEGGEPVVGLLPVRPEWASEFGKVLEELFDPCSDIAVGSAKLSELDDACGRRGLRQVTERRSCMLDLYGRSLGLPALRRAVLADLELPSPFPSDSFDPGVLPSPLAPTARSELFFSVSEAPPPASSHDGEARWFEERP